MSYFKSLRTKYYYWVSSGGALRYSIPNMLYFKELFTYTRAYGLIFFVYNRFMSLFLLLITELLSRTRRKIFYFNNDTYSGNHTCLARSFDVQLFWSFYYYFKNGAVVYCHIIIIFTFVIATWKIYCLTHIVHPVALTDIPVLITKNTY